MSDDEYDSSSSGGSFEGLVWEPPSQPMKSNKPADIDKNAVEELRATGARWRTISLWSGYSMKAVGKWRKRVGYEDPWILLEGEALDNVLRDYLEEYPNKGEIMTIAELRYQGYAPVSREALRDAIRRVDPGGRERRRRNHLFRRIAIFAGPHSHWGMDTCHQLGHTSKYGIVVSGCVDGFSRLIIWMSAHDNNRKRTVARNLREAYRDFGVPAIITMDPGVENISAHCLQLLQCSGNPRSVNLVSGVWNVKMERAWRDVSSQVLQWYLREFAILEDEGMDRLDLTQRFVLHYVYLPRLNADLYRFRRVWNLHGITSIKGRPSPLELCLTYKDWLKDYTECDECNEICEDHLDVYAQEEVVEGAVRVDPVFQPFDDGAMDELMAYVSPATLRDKAATCKQKYYRALMKTYEIIRRVEEQEWGR